MRYIKYGIVVVFIAVATIFSVNLYEDRRAVDQTIPVIQVDSEQIDVSVKATEEELLEGVIATDAKDGDLTNSVIVESISKFVDKEKHIANITYAVVDSDNNVVKKARKVKFTDYKSPEFTLAQPLYFNVGSDIDVPDVLGAEDKYDGDISNKIKILSSTVSMGTAGEYTIKAQVTNSLGDTSKLNAVVIIAQNNNLSPQITLKKNIVYINKGDEFHAEKYIESVIDHNEADISEKSVKVTGSSVDTEEAGCYNVEYTVNDKDGNEGKTYLTVVVED